MTAAIFFQDCYACLLQFLVLNNLLNLLLKQHLVLLELPFMLIFLNLYLLIKMRKFLFYTKNISFEITLGTPVAHLAPWEVCRPYLCQFVLSFARSHFYLQACLIIGYNIVLIFICLSWFLQVRRCSCFVQVF